MRRVWNVEEGLGGEGDPEGGGEGGGEGDEKVLEEGEVIPGGCCRPPSVQTASSLH